MSECWVESWTSSNRLSVSLAMVLVVVAVVVDFVAVCRTRRDSIELTQSGVDLITACQTHAAVGLVRDISYCFTVHFVSLALYDSVCVLDLCISHPLFLRRVSQALRWDYTWTRSLLPCAMPLWTRSIGTRKCDFSTPTHCSR